MRVVQVADFMSSKQFRLIRSLLHFNNNENLADRFFKMYQGETTFTSHHTQLSQEESELLVSSNRILALPWKDNKNVTLLCSDADVEPIGHVKRYDRSTKKVQVACPNVIKQYNSKMGGR